MPIIKEDPLHRYDPLNFKQVKGEVTEAMDFDWKRDKVDDAKKKAIYDSRNYDDFKARVAGCTLKSIHRNDFNQPPKFNFNKQTPGKDGSGVANAATTGVSEEVLSAVRQSAAGSKAAPSAVPKSSREFERALRRQTTAAGKVALLEQLDEDSCAALFGRELDAEVLRQVLLALEKVAAAGEAASAGSVTRQFFGSLTRSCPNSVKMSVSFLTASERNIISDLLCPFPASQGETSEEDALICEAFGV
eukprot:CAMPEP_0178444870 /NCGR_PEP_ID=MMETSP0689_2-20121128/39805_1 /TAXON_ID=160604 /ORGANISM="Amphidinium massartii, Strain CS-259" /LENGTH=246 /DNA_ID=CAMNT_0020069265 /DNA_START=67 /DNA_END=803 /DNA_ORIENTATION=-